ncbi:MAG: PD-(D/E)XK nuclease family protein [Oscillatoriales cyanobacterium]|nr:MAG: PD-(D/E)XK nuclease family protein [Oscillatoriales cyanobacterium]
MPNPTATTPRTLYLDPTLDLPTLLPPDRTQLITATPTIARQLNQRHASLEHLATRMIADRGLAVVSPWLARQLFVEAVADLDPKSDAVAVAQWLTPSLRSLLQSGANLRAMAKVTGLAPKVYRTIAIAQNYRGKLERRSLVDPAELFWRAIAMKPEPQTLTVVGYLHPQADQLAFLEAIAGDGSRVTLPCNDSDWFHDTRAAIEQLQANGWQVVAHSTPPSPKTSPKTHQLPIITITGATKPSEIHPATDQTDQTVVTDRVGRHYTAYADSDCEIRGVLTHIKQLIAAGTPTEAIAIVARANTDYARHVSDAAWEFGLPVRVTRSPHLAETRLGSWMRRLLEVWQSNFRFEATASFLQHPLTPSELAPRWSEVRKRRPDTRTAWETIGADFSAIQSWRKAKRSTWIQRFKTVLATWQLEARCGLWAEETIAYDRLHDAFEELANFDETPRSGEQFARELDTLLTSQPVAITTRGGVAIHSPESIAGSRYAYVFVLGAIEGAYPTPVRNDTAIDFFTRQQLAQQGFDLGSAMRSARQETRLFDALLRVASTQLILSYPRTIGKDLTLPSAYLGQFSIPTTPSSTTPVTTPTTTSSLPPIASLETARRLVWLQSPSDQLPAIARRDPTLLHARRCQRIELDREISPHYSPYDGLTDLPTDITQYVFSASQLSMLGQCGFKWFSRYGLQVNRPQEKETELSGRLRGQLYHKTLEGAMREAIGDDNPRDRVLAALEVAFATAETDLYLEQLPAWWAQRREHLDLLRRTIEHDSFFTPGAVIAKLESAFEGEWNGFKVKGYIDRADETPYGITLIEYKTRSSRPTQAQNSRGEAKFDLQLQLYVEAAGAALFPDRTISRAHYYSLTKAKSLGKLEVIDDIEAAAFADRLRGYLHTGSYPVQPDRAEQVCHYCDSELICRKGSRLKRKHRNSDDDRVTRV